MILEQLTRWWKLASRIAVIAGVGLSFFAVMELVRAYLTLCALHEALGWAFLAVLAGLILWAGFYLWGTVKG